MSQNNYVDPVYIFFYRTVYDHQVTHKTVLRSKVLKKLSKGSLQIKKLNWLQETDWFTLEPYFLKHNPTKA